LGEPNFATNGEVLDFPAAGQTPHGTHIERQKSGNLLRRHKWAFLRPIDACHLRHGPEYGPIEKNKARFKDFSTILSLVPLRKVSAPAV